MAKTIVGLYDDFASAQGAVQELRNRGFDRDQISLVANNATGEYDTHVDGDRAATDGDVTPGEGAGIGAGIGAAIGGLGGLLMGLGLLAIPGVGPALAAGPIVSALAGAAIGGIAGGLAGALVNLGVPEEEAGYYAEGVRRGGTLVTVGTTDEMANDAITIMNSFHPVDIDERAGGWREEGWTSHDHAAEPYTPDQVQTERARYTAPIAATTATTTVHDGGETIPVVEEDLVVGKREVDRGGVRVRSYITETPVSEEVHLREEHVSVERHSVDRDATAADFDAFKEGVIEVTETAEEAVIGKRARVIEEVVVQKGVTEHTEIVEDTVRRTDVEVEDLDTTATTGTVAGMSTRTTTDTATPLGTAAGVAAGTTAGSSVGATQATGFGGFENDFRNYHQSTLASSGYEYNDYAPVYRYGYSIAESDHYQGREWNEIEPEARENWEQRNPGTWDEFKDSIRYAWQTARR